MEFYQDLLKALQKGEKAEDLAELFAKSLTAAEQKMKQQVQKNDIAKVILDNINKYYEINYPEHHIKLELTPGECAEILDQIANCKQQLENLNMDEWLKQFLSL